MSCLPKNAREPYIVRQAETSSDGFSSAAVQEMKTSSNFGLTGGLVRLER